MTRACADVIVPVYNEEEGLPEFFRRVGALDLDLHLIFIDNASTDHSLAILHGFPGAEIIEHQRNEGYGASLRDGMRASTAEKIIIIDADCEYPPEAIPQLIEQLDQHEVVYMSRFLDRRNKGMGVLKMYGNKIISGLFNMLFRQRVTDLYTGAKGFRRQVVADLAMERDGFEHVLEIAARLAKKKIVLHEIPVDFRARTTGDSKMSHFTETIKYLYLLVYYYLFIPAQRSGSDE